MGKKVFFLRPIINWNSADPEVGTANQANLSENGVKYNWNGFGYCTVIQTLNESFEKICFVRPIIVNFSFIVSIVKLFIKMEHES